MKGITVCFSGHRNIAHENLHELTVKLKKVLYDCVKRGFKVFRAGGALGFDTIAAETVLSLKKEYGFIELELVLPCPEQTRRWSENDKNVYESIKERASRVFYTSDHYFRGCMHKRNKVLIENSSLCICYLNDTKGGTAHTVSLAEKHGLEIINIA